MFKQFLKVVEGADFFMVTSFLIFLAFFIVVAIWLLKVDKNYIEKAKQVPLNDADGVIENK
jgi:cbb3-type cytochrome oxidase subunit 3